MLDELEHLPLEYARALNAWTSAWYEEAIEKNFVRAPYRPDETTITRLRCYFHAGLSPAEAVQACFGRKH